ncbi:hypothetical protein RvY_06174 [Ramazzottius varieornatus]|uniref:Chromo domain-containing protein n=1 Tax=Ramazzottius varieornatus TaxID=947166 RepID=A0A1D1UXN3_RAMVA|nr:hypothetical protein RvY_06174 [Ramazzottius varieornatus]
MKKRKTMKKSETRKKHRMERRRATRKCLRRERATAAITQNGEDDAPASEKDFEHSTGADNGADPFAADPSLPTVPDPQKALYEVEVIYGCLVSKTKGELWYSIKWKGYSLKECSWGPVKNFKTVLKAVEDCPNLSLSVFSRSVESPRQVIRRSWMRMDGNTNSILHSTMPRRSEKKR